MIKKETTIVVGLLLLFVATMWSVDRIFRVMAEASTLKFFGGLAMLIGFGIVWWNIISLAVQAIQKYLDKDDEKEKSNGGKRNAGNTGDDGGHTPSDSDDVRMH